ncbi:MAG TPA: GDSL-type esterase/lipase family protein [Polyangiales bacterium]|nr:GDSL-type esterase/lipase family protein [Polyangiales bacterium]
MLYPTSISSSDHQRPGNAHPVDERRSTFDVASGLRRLAAVTVTLGVIASVTYFVPSFERVRPWVAGEGVPVVRLFTEQRKPVDLPDFQGSAAAALANPEPPTDFVAEIPDFNETAAPAPSNPEPTTPAAAVSGSEAPRRAAATTAAPKEKEHTGNVRPIEHAENLTAFFAALAKTAKTEPNAITRVAHYGDSSVAADAITSTARRRLQARFGDAGHGFMLTAKSNMFYGHRDVSHTESSGWQLASIVRKQLTTGLYGYGGIVSTGHPGQQIVFGTSGRGPIGRAVSRFEVFYQRYPEGGELGLSVDEGEERVVQTHADAVQDAWETVNVPDGEHALTLRARGEVRVYGLSQERAVPGVVYDALGLVGARAVHLLNADAKHMAGQIKHRDPDLLVLGFGGNEAGNDKMSMQKYASTLTEVIRLMRAGKPQMACMLFGPLDQGERNARGDIQTLGPLPAIVDTQRQVAKEQGCAFFDTYKAMGGYGAVGRWYNARPRLFGPDLRHATPTGYAIIGDMYYQALMKAFADYQAGPH